MKILDRGELVAESERIFVSNSRLPDAVALDLRAQIGAINVATARLNDLLDDRGEDIVRDVMHQSIDLAERQVRDFILKQDGERLCMHRAQNLCQRTSALELIHVPKTGGTSIV